MRRTWATAASAICAGALSLSMVGCADSSGASSGEQSDGTAGSGALQNVVVYTNSVDGGDDRDAFLADEAKKAGFNLQVVALGGAELTSRLLSEKARPNADVVFGLNQVYFQKLKADDVLAQSEPSWADEVEGAQGLDDDGYYWPIVREPIMLVYNEEAYPDPSEAPSDWPGLWEDERFHDLYEVRMKLANATPQVVISGILVRYRDDNGKFGISDEGWEAISQYYVYGNREEEGVDLYARMKQGIVNMGAMWLVGKLLREEQHGIET